MHTCTLHKFTSNYLESRVGGRPEHGSFTRFSYGSTDGRVLDGDVLSTAIFRGSFHLPHSSSSKPHCYCYLHCSIKSVQLSGPIHSSTWLPLSPGPSFTWQYPRPAEFKQLEGSGCTYTYITDHSGFLDLLENRTHKSGPSSGFPLWENNSLLGHDFKW